MSVPPTPSSREPVRLQQGVPALPGDVRGHPVQQFGRQVSAVTGLAQVLVPDPGDLAAVAAVRGSRRAFPGRGRLG
jgi:hypothetical protein